MKLLLTISALVVAISSLSFVNAVRKPDWGLRCGPYCSNGRPQSGARGPCINTCFGITCRGKAGVLTYAPSGSTSNRRTSGCAARRISPCSDTSLRYRVSGNSCDEYPIATSAQGGFGSVLRCVPLVENQSQGGQLSGYIRANSVRPGDTFQQSVVLVIGSLPYCPNRGNNCQNDGFEFRYSGGAYSNSRRDTESGSEHDFSDASDGPEGDPLPVFKTSGGLLVSGYAADDNPLNRTIWIDGDNGGRHTIVSKLSDDEVQALATAPNSTEVLATC